MKRKDILRNILDGGIVAVVRTSSPEGAERAVEAVLNGGIRVVEVTFTVPGATDVIRRLAGTLGDDVVLGAGTVTSEERARAAIDAGATFIVAPNTDAETIRTAVSMDAVAIPGALTPTEVVAAVNAGADAVKIFPASTFGPLYITALRGPLPDVHYCPTGGVDLDNIPDYFAAGASMVGIGGNLVDKGLVADGNWAEITRRAQEFADAVQGARTQMERA